MTSRLPTELKAPPGAAHVRQASPPRDLAAVRRVLDAAGVGWRDDDPALDEHARDWWPLSLGWAAHGELLARPGLVAAPRSTEEVAAVVDACRAANVPYCPQGGRSGVCGGAVPEPGAVAVDLTALRGVVDFDDTSLRLRALAGTFGPELESWCRSHGVTVGHFPQSMALSTVGGWVACRGAGQFSTRYGKIEDLVRGLTVVLPSGEVARLGGTGPRAAVGPDLVALFVGAEGTLGIVTEVDLVVHPVPEAEARRAYSFGDFDEGLEACRQVLRRGATPAVLRLYDAAESARHFGIDRCVLIVLDEADRALVDATTSIVEACCAGASKEDASLVAHWLEQRNDVGALGPLWERGVVVDTIETAATWSRLPQLHHEVLAALRAVEGTAVATVHQSHAYLDGACLYVTFAGRSDEPDRYYREAWDAATAAILRCGGALSHHHGVGRNRAGYLESALGPAGAQVLRAVRRALDPEGLANPSVLLAPQP